jgi:hypothetical protein
VLLEFFQNNIPTFFGMRNYTVGAVFKSRRKDCEITLTGQQKQGAVAEQARLPVFQVVAGEKLTLRINKIFIIHLLCI